MNTRTLLIGITMSCGFSSGLGVSLAAQAADNPATPVTEDQFLVDIARKGMAEMQISQLALRVASSDEVKHLAMRVLEDHRRANQEIGALAAQRGVNIPLELTDEQRGQYDNLAQLTGQAFEREYISYNLSVHDDDLAQFQQQAATSAEPALRAFAARTLQSLIAHRELAQRADHQVNL